ncbi:unnamed protein product [Symbiodinium pilosum]|uniref:Dextranase n=1 Tax=Symbiodinium pilosum TaxID=2952 RepID=A0A812VR63_SYMPI|nr:unnamed protein product [Symbiodinium pilosum]
MAPIRQRFHCLALCTAVLHALGEKGFEYYAGNEGPWSSEFSVTIHHKGQSVQPHVYGINVPSDRQDGPEPADRSTSWVEFAQPCEKSVSTVEVTRKKAPFPSNVHIRPKRYGIQLRVSPDAHTVSFEVHGCGKHLSVHYGSVYASANSNKYSMDSSTHDAMLLFVSEPTPAVSHDALVIPPGEHYVGNGGVLNISCEVPSVFLQRGAYVYGKLSVQCKQRPTNVYGPGILDGRYFRYHERKGDLWNETRMMLSFGGSAGGDVWGLTVVNPNFRLYDVIVSGSKMRMFRGLGWAANNGGGHFEANTSASNSFIRSTDDLIKVRDGDIATDNMVLWQSYNGGTFQLGWAGLHLVNITHRAASVIENEWRAPDDWEKYDTRPNNAVVSLVDSKSADPAALVGPFVWQDLQIDGDVSHPLSLRLENGVLGNVLFDGLTIAGNVTRFAFATATKGKATIANVTFRNFTIAGRLISRLDDPAFHFLHAGGVLVNTFKFEPGLRDQTILM